MSYVRGIVQLRRRLRNGLQRDGALAVAMRLLFKACSPVAEVAVEVLLAKELGDPLPIRTARVPIDIRQATHDDIPKLVARLDEDNDNFSPAERSIARQSLERHYLDRLNRGEKCFIATSGGQFAHVNWTCFRWGEGFTGLPIVLAEGEVCTTDAITTKAWRGKRIHEAVLNHMLRHATEIGCKRAFTLVALDNVRSLRGVLSLGWYTYGTGLYIRVRGTRKVFLVCLRGRFDPMFRPMPDAQMGSGSPV